MSLQTKVGSFQVPTSGAGNTQAITGLGFQPTLVLFWSVGRTESSDTVGRQSQSSMFGFGISSSKMGVEMDFDTDNSAHVANNFCVSHRNDSCIAHLTTAGALLGSLALSSMDSDGFTLSVGTQYSTAYTVHYLALGGTSGDIQADGGFVTGPGANGTATVSSMSFRPNALILGKASSEAVNVGRTNDSQMTLGFATGSGVSANQVCVWLYENTASIHSQSYASDSNIYGFIPTGQPAANPLLAYGSLQSFNSNGFTIQDNSGAATAASFSFMWIAFSIPKVAAGNFNTNTGTGNFSVTGVGFKPSVVILASHCLAKSSNSTFFSQLGKSKTIGVFTSSSNRGSEAAQIQDNVTNSNVGSAVEFDKVYANIGPSNTIQGSLDAVSMDNDGFTLNQTVGDPQANYVTFLAFGDPPSTSISYNVDVYVLDPKPTHSVDLYMPTGSKSFNVDVYVLEFRVSHSVDLYIGSNSPAHNVDIYVQFFQDKLYARLAGSILFKITPSGFIKLAGTVLQPNRQFIKLAGTIVSKGNLQFVNLGGRIQIKSRNYIKLAGNISGDRPRSFSVDLNVSVPSNLNYINLAGTIIAKVSKGACGGFPDAIYVRLGGWIVNPGNDSRQLPGQGYSKAEDWLSSQDALSSYKVGSIFNISGGTLPAGGINLIVTAFTAGVVSTQTRTRTWLRRVDASSSGILETSETNTHTLPNGVVITTTTTKRQQQDTLVTIITTKNSATPTRTSTVITEKSGSGQTITKEIETNTANGVIKSQEKKNVISTPPSSDNIQPLQVKTLDGVLHYQFFDTFNNRWAGGEQEGLTTIDKSEQISAGTLGGSSTDSFGNQIYTKITNETVTDPSGKIIQTHIEETGTRKDIGTITTETAEQFNGIIKIVTKTTTYPDGSTSVSVTNTNSISGDQVERVVETVTDEFGQTTVTTTNSETKTFPDPVTGVVRQVTTKTVTVDKGGVSTTDTSVIVSNDFEDDIINQKVKVYSIQEFTLSCVIDEFNMEALAEINITQQRNYALLELFGQQLGNGNLSYGLRQKLIKQFNDANACISPVTLQALGRQYRVVFAQSASSFREKYIIGTEPHVYELQMILQARSDLVTGTFGF